MKKIKSFIIALFAFFFMFNVSSCNLEGLMNGLVIPSIQISGSELSDNSNTETQVEEGNYLDEVIAQYGDLLNYYIFVEEMVNEDQDKIAKIKDIYPLVDNLGNEINNYSSLSEEEFNYLISLVHEYKEQIRLIYEDEGTKVEEFAINLYDFNLELISTEYVMAHHNYEIPYYYHEGLQASYWVDMETGIKYDVGSVITIERDYNFRQEFSYESKDDCVDATYMTLVDVNNLEDGTMITNLKVVVTMIQSKYIFIADSYGFSYMIYGPSEDYKEGSTILIKGVKDSYANYGQLTKVEILGYSNEPIYYDVQTIDENNVYDVLIEENNYKKVLLQEAKISSISNSKYCYVNIGGMEIEVYDLNYTLNGLNAGQVVNITGVIYFSNGHLRIRTNEVHAVEKYGEVHIDFENDGIIDKVEFLLYGSEFSFGVGEIPGYKFSHFEEVYIDEYGFEIVNILTYNATLYYIVQHEKVTIRGIWIKVDTIWDDIPNSYIHKYSLWPNNINGDAGGDAFAVINDSTAKFHENGKWKYGLFNTSWRYMIVVDGQGKIAYAVSYPENGYGTPSSYSYYAHPDYANDYTTNPAFNILEGFGPWAPGDDSYKKFEIVVPKGGFIVTAHGKMANEFVSYLSDYKITSCEDYELVNQLGGYNENYRLFFDEATQELRIYEAHNSVRYEGTNSGEFSYNEQTGLFEATFTLNIWNNIKFIYESANYGTITLTRENTNFEGYFTEKGTYGADYTQNLYCDNEEEMKEGKFYCCTNSYTYFATFDPNTMTLKLSDELAMTGQNIVLENGQVYTFNLGEVSEPKHVDGTVLPETYTISDENYCFDIYNISKVYAPAYDAMGNSALKIGTGTAIGTFTMTVNESVDFVTFEVAGYKSNMAVLDINGYEFVIDTFSADGNYTSITIDTTVNKTIVFSTVKSDTEKVSRCMIDSITFGNYA